MKILQAYHFPAEGIYETTFTSAIYYYSARKLILILPSHGG